MNKYQIKELADNIVKNLCVPLHCREDIEHEITEFLSENKIDFKFEIDWSDAPDNATQACVFVQYYDKNKVSLKCRNILGNFERQNIIKIGQTWKNQYGESEIIAVNDKQVVRKDQNGGFMINSIDEIILNFDLVP